MEEAHRLGAHDPLQLVRAHFTAVALDRLDPGEIDPAAAAIGGEAVLHAGIGPIEGVEAVSPFAIGEGEREGDEEAPLEGADLRDRAAHAELRLPAQEMAADRRRETRGHAPDLAEAVGEVAVDRGVTR